MEHPLLVEEFSLGQAPHVNRSAEVEATAPPSSSAAPALPPLPNLPASDVLFITPSDPQYATYLPAANIRSQLSPALRAVCKTEHAVAVIVDWVRTKRADQSAERRGRSLGRALGLFWNDGIRP